jgi:hypothetical protein
VAETLIQQGQLPTQQERAPSRRRVAQYKPIIKYYPKLNNIFEDEVEDDDAGRVVPTPTVNSAKSYQH